MDIIVGYDASTLREKVDLDALAARLDEIGAQRSSDALNEKVGLLRLAGRLDEALEVANAAVRQARFGGDRERLTLARVRRAAVLHAQGKLEPALVELSDCVTEARTHGWADAEAFALHHRGRVRFDQGEIEDAAADFRAALTLRIQLHSPADEIDGAMVAIAIAESFLDGGGD